MFKHRDNVAFAPTTVDPSGVGVLAQPTAAETATTTAAAPTTAGARKRGRDIRGLDRFRHVVFGEDGFPRLHAMATRSPALMYPPDGIPDARKRYQEVRRAEKARKEQQDQERGSGVVEGPVARRFEADDEALWAMFDERRHAELLDNEAESQQRKASAHEVLDGDGPPGREGPEVGEVAEAHNPVVDEQLATYHHKQLDSFLRLVYEFNHTTFVKLPMQDTLSLLARCGKEAVAHVLEYEVKLRMAREGKLRELKELKEMREQLLRRAAQVREESEERELAAAELLQATLDQQQAQGEQLQEREEEEEGNAQVGSNAGMQQKEDEATVHHVSFMNLEAENDDGAEEDAAEAHAVDGEASATPASNPPERAKR